MFPVDEPVVVDVVEAEAELVDEPNFTIPYEQEVVVNTKVMLSTEIAALTGKKYFNVLRDIEVIVEQLNNSLN